MLPIRTILHPTDFSEYSAHAFRIASALARDYQARLVVLHVEPLPVAVAGEGFIPLPPEGYEEEVQAQLNAVQAPDVKLERKLVEGHPPSVIIEVAREINADVIVLGTHGRTGLRRLLMGSVAEMVQREAPCPVLTVRLPIPATEAVEAVEEEHAAMTP